MMLLLILIIIAFLESKNICLIIYSYSKKPWSKFITPENQALCPPEAIDLLSKMLVYDHAERITPKDAMLHPYFAELREKFAKEGNPSLANMKKKVSK